MNPTTPPKFIPVPTASTEGVIYGVIALGVMLLVCCLLGLAAKKKWRTFEEYLVGCSEDRLPPLFLFPLTPRPGRHMGTPYY